MAEHKSQHIHFHTREIDPQLVKDQGDLQTLAGYIDYSLPWQAIYNQLVEILAELNIESSYPVEALPLPTDRCCVLAQL